MSSFKSTYLCNALLDYLFGKTTYTPPATLYFALYTVAPTAAGGGTEVTIGSNAYERSWCTNNKMNWYTAASASMTNKFAITFPTATGTGWGTIVAMGILDAETGGNLLAAVTLAASKTVTAGTVVKFKIGNLTITEA
jgi:hypothetical protein